MVQKDLSVRVHDCPECGLVLDRDLNAAINIERLGLESLGYALKAARLIASLRDAMRRAE
jgi:putative transposase